jgi:hypothetical protein
VRHDEHLHSGVEIGNELSTVWWALEGTHHTSLRNKENAMSVTLEALVTSEPVVTAQVVSGEQPRRR